MRWSIKAALLAASVLASGQSFAQFQPAPRQIEVAQLGDVDPFEVGVNPVLPDTVWSTGHAGALNGALSVLPDRASPGWTSPAAARLALNALRSSGEPPRGGRDDFRLAAKRADRALAASRAQLAYELLSRTPRVNESDPLSRVFAETALAMGRTQEACRAADALLEGRDAAYWLRLRASCLALDGAIPAAELTAELARAQAESPNFDILFDALVLGRSAPEDFQPRTALQLTLLEALAPGVRLVPHEDAPGWLHLAAERTGPAIALPETLPEALETAVTMEGAERAAALGALIGQDIDREIAAEALAVRLSDAAQQGLFMEAALTFGPEVASLPITEDTLAHGVHFVLAALAADDLNAAERWREALMDGPPAPAPAPSEDPLAAPATDLGTLPSLDGEAIEPGEEMAAEEPEWQPPAPGVLVALDFARAIALDEVRDDAFMALLAARLETATPERLCQAAGLVALGANDQGELQQALSGLTRQSGVIPPAFGPLLLAAGAGALGETQLHAASLLDRHPDDAETCGASMLALDHAGLRRQALQYLLARVIEDAA
ncbi:hypothetical protein ACFELO_02445 [Oceanicaulis sp. LC35]|uniref:hypothetical protein n=1 Tax=Oceanicaulis sp. LC35 TaxID=3349635 RepID=UPI003F871FD2